jgi:hypothetical protein
MTICVFMLLFWFGCERPVYRRDELLKYEIPISHKPYDYSRGR